MAALIIKILKGIVGDPINLLPEPPAMIRWKSRPISMKAQWLSEISSVFWQIFRLRHSMKRSKDFMIQNARFAVFEKAVEEDVMGRAASVQK